MAPKSAAGFRVVPNAAALRRELGALPRGDDGDLVFGRGSARPFSASGIIYRAKRLWRAGGLEPINPHECRHTFASLMIAAGVNLKALQVFIGHASITTRSAGVE